MLGLVYLVFVIVLGLVVSNVKAGDGFEQCLEIFKPENMNMKCCDIIGPLGNYDECKQSKDECAQSRCVLEKVGIKESSGKLDETSAKTALDKLIETSPEEKEMLDRVKQYCLDGQYQDYAFGDNCDAISFQICSFINAVVVCPKWKQTEQCKKMENAAKECRKALDEME